MCYSLVLYSLCDVIVILYYVKKIIAIKYSKILKDILPSLLSSFVVGGLMYITQFLIELPVFQLIISLIIGLISYICIAKFFKFQEMIAIESIVKIFAQKSFYKLLCYCNVKY